jgi:phosphopantothenoylcysteine decarboxylase/phosphopantothenate--cysteine ligase
LPFHGKTFLVTAGPTYEAIDPVRFVGNHSSGLMGFEIAKKAALLGAEIIYITGPSHYKTNDSRIKTIPVVSAHEMYTQVHSYFGSVDVAVLSAAVADYKPKNIATSKIKKSEATLSLELEKTKDILASLGAIKSNQLLVGFALETHDEVDNAIKKLKSKNLDLIVLNSLNDEGAGFGGDTNKVTLIDKNLVQTVYPLKSKVSVATDIMATVAMQFSHIPK